jgi:hypothetical protein
MAWLRHELVARLILERLRRPLANGEQRAAAARERLVDGSRGLDDERAGRVVAAHVVLEHAVEHQHQLGPSVRVEVPVRTRLEPEQQRRGLVAHDQRHEVDAVAAVLDPGPPRQIVALPAVADHVFVQDVGRSLPVADLR